MRIRRAARAELIAADADESGMVNRDVRAIILCQHSLAKLDIEIFNGSVAMAPLPALFLGPALRKRRAHFRIAARTRPGTQFGKCGYIKCNQIETSGPIGCRIGCYAG